MIIPGNLAAASAMDGFKNYQSAPFSVSVPSQNLGVGGFVAYSASTPLNRTNSVSQVQVQYSGLSAEWYVCNGMINTFWSSNSYEIESLLYFDATNLYIYNVIANQTGGTVTIPAITINCAGFSFIAPF